MLTPLATVVAVGARTTIGLDARDTAFLYRAGSAGMTEAAILDSNDEPFTLCLLPTLDPRLTGPDRVVWLGLPALAEALAPLGAGRTALRGKLLLCMDDHLSVPYEGGMVPAGVVAGALMRRLGEIGAGDLPVEPNARGPAGAGFALAEGIASLQQGALDYLVLGGVHSDYDIPRLRSLEYQERVFSPTNLDSLIPGEAAAFAVLMHPEVARRSGLPARVHVCAVETAYERARPDNDEPAFVAAGLTVIFQRLGAHLERAQAKAGWLLTDLTFEMWRLNESMAVWARSSAFVGEPNLIDSPAQRLGYLGAAVMPLHLALAAEGWRRGFAPSRAAISYAGSDPGERAGMLLLAPA
ncbi:MAG: hypothetical protein WKG00_16320 [Polyangiaceae bacterium]